MCRDDEAQRKLWGCDAPIEGGGVKVLGCPACSGRDSSCATCSGEDAWIFDRCPLSSGTVEGNRVVQLAQFTMNQVVILPVAGGWQQQAAVFVDLVLFAMSVLGRYDKEGRDRDREKAEREAKKGWRQNSRR